MTKRHPHLDGLHQVPYTLSAGNGNRIEYVIEHTKKRELESLGSTFQGLFQPIHVVLTGEWPKLSVQHVQRLGATGNHLLMALKSKPLHIAPGCAQWRCTTTLERPIESLSSALALQSPSE